MKHYFKKIYPFPYSDRWYAYQRSDDGSFDGCEKCYLTYHWQNLIDLLKNHGFSAQIEELCWGPEPHMIYYSLYVEINSLSDEAAFILLTANGVEDAE